VLSIEQRTPVILYGPLLCYQYISEILTYSWIFTLSDSDSKISSHPSPFARERETNLGLSGPDSQTRFLFRGFIQRYTRSSLPVVGCSKRPCCSHTQENTITKRLYSLFYSSLFRYSFGKYRIRTWGRASVSEQIKKK
jgi:hypothetical protein